MKKKLPLLWLTGVLCALPFSSLLAQDFAVEKLWEKNPADLPEVLGTSHLERGMAFNATTGHLLVPSRSGNNIHILEAATGDYIGVLDKTNIAGGTWLMNKVAVDADGVVYVANMVLDSSGASEFRLYRWENESAQPVRVFSGDPSGGSGGRWGDSLALRGSGSDTQILLGSFSGTNLALLRPDPADLSGLDSFSSTPISTSVNAGHLRNVAFGPGNIIYATRPSGATGDGQLWELELDAEQGTAATLRVFEGAHVARAMGPIAYGDQADILAGLRPLDGMHDIFIYRRGHLSTEWTVVPLATPAFAGPFVQNTNGTGEVIVAGNRIFALDTNNGILALSFPLDAEGFDQWIAQQDVPEGQRGPQDDPDGDGATNLSEYAFGGDPAVANVEVLPVVGMETVGDARYLSIAYSTSADAQGIDIVVEVSDDLVTWESGAAHTTVVEEDATGAVVRDNTPMSGASRRFIRLRVVQN